MLLVVTPSIFFLSIKGVRHVQQSERISHPARSSSPVYPSFLAWSCIVLGQKTIHLFLNDLPFNIELKSESSSNPNCGLPKVIRSLESVVFNSS